MFGLVPFMARNNDLARGNTFDRLLDAFDEPFFTGFGRVPEFKVDVKDKGDAYEINAELPGLKKENISLKYENNYLTISTKQEDAKDEQDEKGNYVRRERAMNSMSRSFYLEGIDEEKCAAGYTDGILTVHLPKATHLEKNGHTIEISDAAK